MSSEDDELAALRHEQALRQHQREKEQPGGGGLAGHVEDALTRGADVVTHRARLIANSSSKATLFVSKAWSWLDRPAHLIIRAGTWAATRAAELGVRIGIRAAIAEDASGRRYFSPWKLSRNFVKAAIVATLAPLCAGGLYYYGTLRTYKDVYIPNAGVFVNQQFIDPSQPGHVVAPRDEVFTVLGQHVDEEGRVIPIRFDVDSNLYFFFYSDSWRPDLAAAEMVPQSPYGAMCTVRATGMYTRLPRYLRYELARWFDVRPEIVDVVECEQLTQVPPEYREVSGAHPAGSLPGSNGLAHQR